MKRSSKSGVILLSAIALVFSCESPAQEEVVEEVVEEALDQETTSRPAKEEVYRAGGKYGGRHQGHERLGARGGAKAASAIMDGLTWLAAHQDENGRWSAAEFMKHDPKDAPSTGAGKPVHDIGATSLALLAFLGNGSTLRSGPHKQVIKKGIGWLQGQQQKNGLIGSASGHAYMYNHGIATVAMVEAYGLSAYKVLQKPAQLALDYICKARNPYKVWRYYPKDGQNDSSVTGWMVMALCAGRDFKLKIDPAALKFARAWYEEATDPATGKLGYTKRGEPSSRIAETVKFYPANKTEALTASGLFHRFLLGENPKENPVLMQAADSCLSKLPTYNEKDGSIDYYYWYYGSYAMFQMGGRHWKVWKKSLGDALIKPQVQTGSEKGSWNPAGAWGSEGGRVYSTALAVLTLECFYRYTRMVR